MPFIKEISLLLCVASEEFGKRWSSRSESWIFSEYFKFLGIYWEIWPIFFTEPVGGGVGFSKI